MELLEGGELLDRLTDVNSHYTEREGSRMVPDFAMDVRSILILTVTVTSANNSLF